METIEAIYEHGVFRPVEPVQLAENSRVHLQIVNGETSEVVQQGDGLDAIYEIMDRRYDSGYTDTAARHNEHQP
jgi:predicted DNA-binding antitoxin AbrB/MazE fold protein